MNKSIAGKKYVFPGGSPIPLPVMIFGYVLIFLGIGFLREMPYVTIGMLLLGGYLGVQGQGAEVNLKESKMRVYASFAGVRYGKWRNLQDFPFITVVRRKTAERIYSQTMQISERKKSFYSVCMLSKSHHTRIVLVNIEGEEEAVVKARELAKALNLEYTAYNPVLSGASKARRDRRG